MISITNIKFLKILAFGIASSSTLYKHMYEPVFSNLKTKKNFEVEELKKKK